MMLLHVAPTKYGGSVKKTNGTNGLLPYIVEIAMRDVPFAPDIELLFESMIWQQFVLIWRSNGIRRKMVISNLRKLPHITERAFGGYVKRIKGMNGRLKFPTEPMEIIARYALARKFL